ncbi:hypothetical protein CF319_g7749, partial [Tilletia indica]
MKTYGGYLGTSNLRSSPCGLELNFVKAEATPVWFQESDQEGNLHWAGPLETPFEPGKMVVKGRYGLPIPFPTLCSSPSPTGEYSFGSSFLALTHLSSTPRLSSMAR